MLQKNATIPKKMALFGVQVSCVIGFMDSWSYLNFDISHSFKNLCKAKYSIVISQSLYCRNVAFSTVKQTKDKTIRDHSAIVKQVIAQVI